jgi:hypothetical protein
MIPLQKPFFRSISQKSIFVIVLREPTRGLPYVFIEGVFTRRAEGTVLIADSWVVLKLDLDRTSLKKLFTHIDGEEDTS